jgi:hypothetical protein
MRPLGCHLARQCSWMVGAWSLECVSNAGGLLVSSVANAHLVRSCHAPWLSSARSKPPSADSVAKRSASRWSASAVRSRRATSA